MRQNHPSPTRSAARLAPLLGLVLAGAASLGAGCTPYAPDLPPTPFKCNATEPKCPDGYQCVDQGSGRLVCQAASGADGGVVGPDASNFSCNDDTSLEPNDSFTQSSPTNVATSRKSLTLAQLAICPAKDKDTFAVDVVVANTNIEAIATVTGGAPVSVSILNSTGVPITNGSQTATMTRAYTANAPIGTFFVQVYGTDTSRTNYNLTINTTP